MRCGTCELQGGILDKFLGDGLMVIFEAGLHDHRLQRQNAESATRLASALHQCHAARSGLNLRACDFPRVQLGVHTGPRCWGV